MTRPAGSPPATVRVRADSRRGFLIINASDLTPEHEVLSEEVHETAPDSPVAPKGPFETLVEAIVDSGATGTAKNRNEVPAFLHGLTRPVLEAMKYSDLQELAKRGELPYQSVKKQELIAALCEMAGL